MLICKWIFDYIIQPFLVVALIDVTLQVIGDDFDHHVNWDTESAIWFAIIIFVLITLFGTSDGLKVAQLIFVIFVVGLLPRCILQLKEHRSR